MSTAIQPVFSHPRLRGLSLRHRLSLFIGGLLLLIVTVLGWLSYIGVRKASMAIGKERLSSLTSQLGALLGKGAADISSATKVAAGKSSIINLLYADNKANNTVVDSAKKALNLLRTDSTWIEVELLSADHKPILRSFEPGKTVSIDIDSLLQTAGNVDTSFTGPLYLSHDTVFYPIVATVINNRQVAGYLVRWRWQTTTADALSQFSKLLGTNARIYFGTNDGKVWTDLFHGVNGPPVNIATAPPFLEYSRPGKDAVVAAISPVPNTNWVLLVEFSRDVVLAGADRFLKWIILIGALVVAAGLLAAWLMSRRITRPLEKLTIAASAISEGKYNATVNIPRNDELGMLAHAFNEMTAQLQIARDGLEQTVRQRTRQLEAVNSELEAFSYSVSHDLRAPLRSISGYAGILQEDYASKMDDEAMRLTGKIISNGKKMGQLIDDLISFSQVARKEIRMELVDMQALVKSCEEGLLPTNSNYHIKTGELPPCKGDEGLLRQVWSNLIANAIKYSSKNATPQIEIGCESNGDVHTYFVRDNGAGFDMQYSHKLFGVFQRLHSNKEFEGTGIGLALTKRIINRHNGNIYAEGKTGEGACFYFNLSK